MQMGPEAVAEVGGARATGNDGDPHEHARAQGAQRRETNAHAEADNQAQQGPATKSHLDLESIGRSTHRHFRFNLLLYRLFGTGVEVSLSASALATNVWGVPKPLPRQHVAP